MKLLDYCVRWCGTAISFACFGLGGSFQGLFIHPVIWLCVRDPVRRRRAGRCVVANSMKLFMWLMQSLGLLTWEIQGREHVKADKNYLILANHPSLIDVIVLVAGFPEANCIVKSAVARSPLFAAVIRSSGYISNEDPVAMLVRAADSLRAGGSLIMFPEGTRTDSGGQPRFPEGAAALAFRAGCDCLPAFISCSPPTLTRQDKWYQVPERRVRFIAAIQPPLDPADRLAQAPDRRAQTPVVIRELPTYFLAGPGEPPADPVKMPTG